MTNKLKYHKNYTELGAIYQLVLPLTLEGLVPDDDSVRLLYVVIGWTESRPTTAQLQDFVQAFWQKPAKTCFIRWFVA